MANYQLLKADIDEKVYQNGHQEITGENLNFVLNQMVTTLGAGYQFAGVATTATNPGTPDAKVFYIANGKGTYTNFGGLEVTEDDVVVLYYDTEWHKVATGIASQAKLTELDQKVEKLDIETINATYTTNEGYINFLGNVASAGGHSYTSPIDVMIGDVIYLDMRAAPNEVAIISTFDDGVYTPQVLADDNYTPHRYEYKAKRDGKVVISGESAYLGNVFIDRINAIADNAHALEEEFSILGVASTKVSIERYNNAYITNTGLKVADGGNHFVSAPIFVPKGNVLSFNARATPSAIAVISKTDKIGSVCIPLVVSDSNYTKHKYEYQVKESGYYILSGEYAMSDDFATLYGSSLVSDSHDAPNVNKVYVGSTRNVKTLKEVFDLLGDATEDKPNIIYLDAGTFNVFDGIDLDSQDTSFRGLDVPNHTYLIGQGVGETILDGSIASGKSNLDYNNISTLNMEYVGGCENMTILAHNTRDCIHTDCMRSTNQEEVCKIHHKNVTFYHDGLDAGVGASAMAYGCGMRSNAQVTFDNCLFRSNYGGRATFNLHNNAGAIKASIIVFNSCTFLNESYDDNGVVGISSEGTGNDDKVVFNGCHIEGGISYNMLNSSIFDQTISGGGNGFVRVFSNSDYAYAKIFLEGYERVRATSLLTYGQIVALRSYNRVEFTTDSDRMYGVVLNDSVEGKNTLIQTGGLIKASLVGITGNDGQKVSVVNGALVVSDDNPVGVITGDGIWIQMKW